MSNKESGVTRSGVQYLSGSGASLSQPTSVADALLRLLEREGVEYLFGVPGSALTPMYEALREHPGLTHILAKHEEGAAFMAYGYAAVKRTLGVCIGTTGPGATNAITGAACALADGMPVLFVSGQTPTRQFGKGAVQDSTRLGVDSVGLYDEVAKLSVSIPSGERAQDILDSAIRTALSGRPGPVHIGIPVDVQKQRPAWNPRRSLLVCSRARPFDPASLDHAVQLLSSAKRPAILAGHGVNISGAWAALFELATRLGVPVATTPKAKGAFPETHPLSLGVFGFGGHLRAEAYLLGSEIDVLLVVGSSLGEFSTNDWDERLQPSQAMIQIDVDPEGIGRSYAVDVPVVGDARATLEAMVARCPVSSRVPNQTFMEVCETIPKLIETAYLEAPERPLKPQRLVHEMGELMPKDALLFVDTGNCILWANHYFESSNPGTYFLSLGFASMGNGLCAAIGGKLAAPSKTVVALVGDGAFAMNGMEVHTAVENRVPVIWVVLNNGGHGMVYHGERMVLGHDLGANRFRAPLDIAAMARAMGAAGVRVDSTAAFRRAFAEALTSGQPTVIDAVIDAEEVPQPLTHRARAVARSIQDMPVSARSPWAHAKK